jgi:hypothetical protein
MTTMTDMFAGRKPADWYASRRERAALPTEKRAPDAWGELRDERLRSLTCEIGVSAAGLCTTRPFHALFFEVLETKRQGAPPSEADVLTELAIFWGRHVASLENLRLCLLDALHHAALEPTA